MSRLRDWLAGWRRGPAPAPGELAAGHRVGAYRIEERIGRGSSGSVYRAVDARDGQAVALKVLRLPRPAATAQQGFRRESAAARRLQHADIADILDAGEAGGLAWLAMTLAPGRDLQAHTQPGNLLPVAEVLEIGARVAAALAHAHRQGVLHRDVKPANIVADRAGANGLRVMLTDFGVARIAQGAGLQGPAATRSGELLGTVAYMAPEQLAGAAVEPASDFHALGATLYHLLTAHLPHEAATLSQLMQRIAQVPAPDARGWQPALDAATAALLQRLLAKAPAQRPTDGDALAAELRALAAHARG